MALNLLDSFGKRGVSYGLATVQADVNDTDYASKYFVVSEISPTFTAGRNSLAFNGSALLQPGSQILIECLDAAGNNLFVEMALSTNAAARTYPYKESTAFIFSIHVYNDTVDGIGRLFLYGTLNDGRSVKWTRNITIDKTLRNSSKVRFYNRPLLEVDAVQVPVLSTSSSANLKSSITFTGGAHGLAVDPPKDTNLPSVNRRNVNIDYRMISDAGITRATDTVQCINSQMIGAIVDVTPTIIQSPLSSMNISPPASTQSYVVYDVVDNKTIKIIDPYFYTDGKGNQIITNIVTGSISITYPYISYNNATSSYLQSNINGVLATIQNSYADVIYRNIRTFTGFLARHKVYRKSLLSNADFSIIADEPLFINEMLIDNLTQNKYYDLLGKFYNQQHINRYWFTGSNNITMEHTPDVYIDSMHITAPNYNSMLGGDFIMVKNDSVLDGRNSQYIPFDQDQFNATSGSSYDSNFIDLKANVQYILQVSAVVEKDSNVTDAKLELYYTSSLPNATQDTNFTSQHGIKLATLTADNSGTKKSFDNQIFFYTPPVDLYGTLVIVPYKCQAYLKNISFRVYGDDGFSPDVFISRIPWDIAVAGETFQIKSELFDINHNLVYSDLQVVQNFDPSGSTLIPYIPGDGIIQPGTLDAIIQGSIYVGNSAYIQTGDLIVYLGQIYVPHIGTRPTNTLISASRLVSVREDAGFSGQLAITPIVDIGHTTDYLYVGLGSLGYSTIDPSNMSLNPVTTRTSIASKYTSQDGGHIYFGGVSKTEERPSGY